MRGGTENVPGIVNLALDEVLTSMEEEGFEVQTFLIPACGIDAPHKRNRVAIVANAIDGRGPLRRNGELSDIKTVCGTGDYYRGGAEELITGEWRENKSGILENFMMSKTGNQSFLGDDFLTKLVP